MNLRISELRDQNNMTQSQLAEAIGTTLRKISAWERQETPIPLEWAVLIADTFKCSLDELAGRKWSPSAYADKQQARLNANYESVTDPGKQRIAEHSEDIATNPAYRLAAGRVQDSPLPTQEVA